MNKILFLFSGEGTSHRHSGYALLKYSRRWSEIEQVLKTELDLDLESLWKDEIGRHRCPHSPLLTLITQICLADLWVQWGYRPDVVLGHSIGELAAAYQAGHYSLKEVLLLAYRIGRITAKLGGIMAHGTLSEAEIEGLAVHVSAINFMDGDKKHVTLCGYTDQMEDFLAKRIDFTKMQLPHPWHHPDYRKFYDLLEDTPSQDAHTVDFVSGLTRQFEKRLDVDYWRHWMTHAVDFVGAMQTIQRRYNEGETLQIIEIGFHPVLDKCCAIFERYTYASSMFRGEDEIQWILHQRKRLDQEPLMEELKRRVKTFDDRLDFKTSLAYQGFTSLTFVKFTEHIRSLFPSLAPQDFYRYKTIDQLSQQFGDDRLENKGIISAGIKNEVVIAAMSCRLPSAVETPTQFWKMLLSKEDQVASCPERANFQAGFLNDSSARFDYQYFNIAESEVQTMDPQQILALELTELLWKDAGIDPSALDRKRIGVYIGAWNQEYAGNRDSVYYPTGTNPSIIAGRISYHFDLRGPSWVSNTACSSSLVAIHYAAKDIEAGRVDFAVAGGVNMIIGRRFTDSMRHSGFLSKDDRCKTFDDSANGYARAEGGGLILLARRDLVPQYYAALSGSAINQNGGRTQVITAPHPEAQEEVITEACREAGIKPQDIAYIECHGTGTKIGDPIEISAIQNTIAKNRDGQCLLGSVKSNLGHLESAAGIAGLIKSVLILNQGRVPPNLHFQRPNTFIDFDGHGLRVVTEPTSIDRQAYIGVSSFGFGGANAHIVIKGADDSTRKPMEERPIPFDRGRSRSILAYYPIDEQTPLSPPRPSKQDGAFAGLVEHPSPMDENDGASTEITRDRIDRMVLDLFFQLTGIETIDPEVELTEQGLDSMSVTELLSQLESMMDVELDPDIVFEFPLVDQFVDQVYGLARAQAKSVQ